MYMFTVEYTCVKCFYLCLTSIEYDHMNLFNLLVLSGDKKIHCLHHLHNGDHFVCVYLNCEYFHFIDETLYARYLESREKKCLFDGASGQTFWNCLRHSNVYVRSVLMSILTVFHNFNAFHIIMGVLFGYCWWWRPSLEYSDSARKISQDDTSSSVSAEGGLLPFSPWTFIIQGLKPPIN